MEVKFILLRKWLIENWKCAALIKLGKTINNNACSYKTIRWIKTNWNSIEQKSTVTQNTRSKFLTPENENC